jgi:hypothetical protein
MTKNIGMTTLARIVLILLRRIAYGNDDMRPY